ncbi:MAG: nucleotidyltransferase domain-containing protein [Deltaproteobacteria bacterium]|nr:nucleotidyltransferase domain-containing protein [Deltaproteobacteria bacterium]
MTSPIDGGELAALFLRAAKGEAVGAELAGRLSSHLGSPVEGVILYGSLARGRRDDHGDIDALLIADSAAIGIFGTSGQIDLDLPLLAPSALERAEAKDWIHIDGGRVLFDATGEAQRLLDRAAMWRARGPESWSNAARDRAATWCRRMCGRIASNLEGDPALAALQAGTLRAELYESYFRARGLWTRSARDALTYWRAHDHVFADLVEDEARAGDGEHRLDLLAAMVERVFE